MTAENPERNPPCRKGGGKAVLQVRDRNWRFLTRECRREELVQKERDIRVRRGRETAHRFATQRSDRLKTGARASHQEKNKNKKLWLRKGKTGQRGSTSGRCRKGVPSGTGNVTKNNVCTKEGERERKVRPRTRSAGKVPKRPYQGKAGRAHLKGKENCAGKRKVPS